MEAIDELLARDHIRELAQRYALYVDAKDIDGIASLFTDGVENGRYGPGREGVRTFYDHALRKYHCTMHLVANHVIDFDDGTHARGVVYCRAHHHVVEPGPEHWFDEAYAYWDTYEKVDGSWLFTARRPKAWYHQEWGHPDHGVERVAPQPRNRAFRGDQMPEAFETWGPYWDAPPRPLPTRHGTAGT
jgi:hypothetical protein